MAWLPRARRSPPGSRASGPAPPQQQGGAVMPGSSHPHPRQPSSSPRPRLPPMCDAKDHSGHCSAHTKATQGAEGLKGRHAVGSPPVHSIDTREAVSREGHPRQVGAAFHSQARLQMTCHRARASVRSPSNDQRFLFLLATLQMGPNPAHPHLHNDLWQAL